MAVSSCSLSLAPGLLCNKMSVVSQLSSSSVSMASPPCSSNVVAANLKQIVPSNEERWCQRRSIVMGAAALAIGITPASSILADQGVPANYSVFVDKADGYSYYYPSDWRDFDFRAHDSAFKDRYLQLQNVRLSFIPTEKADVHDLGPMEEVIPDLVNYIFAAPNQKATIYDMQERSSDGRNYYTVEYVLTSPNFARSAFATIAIANGRYYTLIVGANDRRWKRVRKQLKVVADSFKVFDI
ncbi:hypothetical protein V2J09_002473 [Rumex salicifolius]